MFTLKKVFRLFVLLASFSKYLELLLGRSINNQKYYTDRSFVACVGLCGPRKAADIS